MAYVVGSASVEIVPDFRNAQLAITAFFNRQANEIHIPVTPDIDKRAVDKVERQATETGNRVGQAISDAATRNVQRNLSTNISREIKRLETDIAKARKVSEEATRAAAITEQRLAEMRAAGRQNTAAYAAAEETLRRQRLRASEADQILATSSARLLAAREELFEVTAREAEEAGRKAAEAQRKSDRAAIDSAHATAIRINAEYDRRVAAALKAAEKQSVAAERASAKEIAAAERAAAAEMRILERSIDQQNRAQERAARERARFAEAEAKRAARASALATRAVEKVKVQVEVDRQRAIKSGRDAGGLIARAMEQELKQNAGIISAVLAGVLAAGAPAAIAGASALFVGIGAVAAAQNDEIRQSWKGLWTDIKTQTQADAAVLVPVFDRMAGAIGQSFQRMRPLLRDAFTEVGPQIDSMTDSLTKAAENALPGIVAAVRNAGPVIDGLGKLMENIGTGVGEFFQILSTHAPAAGSALSSLGDAFAELLPLLADLLGTGAEVASNVLPAITAAFSVVHTALNAVSGILPTVLTGFLAFRQVQGLTRILGNWASSLATASTSGGLFAAAQGRAATALSAVGRSLPVVGAAAAGLGALFAESQEQITGWSQALNEGGEAARQARADMAEYDTVMEGLQGGFADAILNATGFAGILDLVANDTDEARTKNQEYLASLTPLETAQRDLDIATRALAKGQDDQGLSASELAGLQGQVARASARVAAAQADLEMATRGVTEAMIAQVEQSRAQVDSSFAYEKALNDLEDAQKGYDDAVSEFGANSEEAQRAALDLAMAYRDVGAAASDKAIDALPAAMDEQQKAIVGAAAELDYYHGLLEQGVDLPPELDEHVAYLESVVAGADQAAIAQGGLIAALGEVGIAAEAIPNEKAVQVDALTDEAIAQLEDLGFKVREQPDGSFKIIAETDEAQNNMSRVADVLRGLDGAVATPVIDLDDKNLKVKTEGALASLRTVAKQTTKPILDADGNPIAGQVGKARGILVDLDRQRPRPPLDADGGPVAKKLGTALTGLRNFAAQRPTPPLNADGAPASSKVGKALGELANFGRQRPTPVLGANDSASGIIGRVLGLIGSIPASRTTTITTIMRTVYETVGNIPFFPGATGGAIEAGAIWNKQNIPTFKYDIGGAVVGRGTGIDDLVPAAGPFGAAQYRLGNGEHVLDARDVALMGGQAGVYAFREMLNSGKIGSIGADDSIQRVVANTIATPAPVQSGIRDVTILTQDNPAAIIRAVRAEQQQQAALQAIW